MVGQICRLWFANPCPEEQRGITCGGINRKGGRLVGTKSVCWGMVFVPLASQWDHSTAVWWPFPRETQWDQSTFWHLEGLHLGSLGCRSSWSEGPYLEMSASLRISHRQNANCKLDIQLSSSGLRGGSWT